MVMAELTITIFIIMRKNRDMKAIAYNPYNHLQPYLQPYLSSLFLSSYYVYGGKGGKYFKYNLYIRNKKTQNV